MNPVMNNMAETKTIYKALLEAQKKIEPVTKDASNPFFKSSYATLGAVNASVIHILNDEGIVVTQPIKGDKVVTVLTYIDGSNISDEGTPIVCAKPNDPQAQGSAITYARRYGLMSLLCLSAEDDDGESATNHQPAKTGGSAGVPATGVALPTIPSGDGENKIDVVREPVNKLVVYCEVCNTEMHEFSGISKKTGKPFYAYKCPKDGNHPLRFV